MAMLSGRRRILWLSSQLHTIQFGTNQIPSSSCATPNVTEYTATRSSHSSTKEKFLDAHGKIKAVSFSGAGWLLVYHLGVIDALRHLNLAGPSTIYAGASAGALAACVAAADIPTNDLLNKYIQFGDHCRQNGRWARGKVLTYLQHILNEFVTDDLHEKIEERVLIAVTILPKWRKPILIDRFESREDLINTLLTSCFVPFYLNGKAVTTFRDHPAIDGGIAQLIPTHPERLQHAIHVCPFPPVVTRITRDTVHIGPHLQDRVNLNLRKAISTAFRPPTKIEAHSIYQAGYSSSVKFSQENLLTSTTTSDNDRW
eukprot:gene5579-7221_t